MPILVERTTGKVIRDTDINQLVQAFNAEHHGDRSDNIHRKKLTLGPVENADREIIAKTVAGDRKLIYSFSLNTWGQNVGNGFEPFITSLTINSYISTFVNPLLSGLNLSGFGILSGQLFYSRAMLTPSQVQSVQASGGIFLSGMSDERFAIVKPFYITGGVSTPVRYVLGERRTGFPNDQVLISGELGIVDMATRIDRDGLGNMTLTDALAGTWKLSTLSQGSADRYFSPEFDDAVVHDFLGHMVDSNNEFKTGFDNIEFHNYYSWQALASPSYKETMVVLRVKLPEVFQGWANIRLFLRTTGVADMTALLFGTNNVAQPMTISGGSPAFGMQSDGVWSQITLVMGATTGAQFVGGQYVTVQFIFRSQQGGTVYLGEVELNYA